MTSASATQKQEWGRWAEEELGGAGLGDTRLDRRLVGIAEAFLGAPEGSIPRSTGSWRGSKGAYRFFSNDKVEPEKIYDRHRQNVIERSLNETVLLALSDTTYLDYSGHFQSEGLGPLADLDHEGLVVQPTLVVTPQRLALGLIQQKVWARDREQFGKSNEKGAKKRSIEKKESVKWLQSLEASAEFQKDLAGRKSKAKVISVFDREGDVFEVLAKAARSEEGNGLLVRASWDRRVKHPQGHLWSFMEAQPIAGTVDVTIPRKPLDKERVATLSIRFAKVTIRPPRNRTVVDPKPVEIFCVYALEEDTPPGVSEPISWMLLTTEAVASFDDACRILQWYTCRWLIEMYFKVLKSGCKAEERQLETAERLIRCLAMDSIVAWKIIYMTFLSREVPDLPCTAVFEEHEWKGLWVFVNRSPKLPDSVPSLREVIRLVGRLGGHLGRKSDGEPGTMTLWRGLQRLPDIAGMWVICRENSG
jgi:hypothetical protein